MGIVCSFFGVFGKAVDEIIVIGSGNATAGIDHCSKRTGIVVQIGNGVRGGDGRTVPCAKSPVLKNL